MNKLNIEYQARWESSTLYSRDVLDNVGQNVKLHNELDHVLSSAAACLNVLGNLNNEPSTLIEILNSFGLEVQDVIRFPSDSNVGGELYDDSGYVVFEWIGPKRSTINERGGGRGQNRTSIDAYVLTKIGDKLTQILIEWKFTESYDSAAQRQKFAGIAGTERARRYSKVLAKLRRDKQLPFNMEYEGGWGLHDLGYEPLYQLLRMTLLAKTTTPLQIGEQIEVDDYRILHLTHSKNSQLNTVTERHLQFCPGLTHLAGTSLHELWGSILGPDEAPKFKSGHWDEHLDPIKDTNLRTYLSDRYA